jgi:pimeloyl-ACP methyl ester carboxylesterase/LysM repeat protein
VFVHGILGDSVSTWTNKNGAYWPALLGSDPFFTDYDVYVYDYPSSFYETSFTIDEIAENMRLMFDEDKIRDYNKILFVSHSMGGLATRAYLNKNRDVGTRVSLAYFYSTPTTGSELAAIASLASSNPMFSKMKPMQSSADYLADLQRQWLSINSDIPSFCAYETQKTYNVKVVTQSSATNLCNQRLDPINADHFTIVKPGGPRDSSYLVLKAAIQKMVRKESEPQSPVVSPSQFCSVRRDVWRYEQHTVQLGDTYSGLAEKYYGNGNDKLSILIQNANPNIGPLDLKKDQQLQIPFGQYTAVRGDTLENIAEKLLKDANKSTLIRRLNPGIENPNYLEIGQPLQICPTSEPNGR